MAGAGAHDVAAEAARLRQLGRNIIPIRPGTKIPVAGEGDIVRWRKDGCSAPIGPADNMAMLHGPTGGTWAIDLDDQTILADLTTDMARLEQACVVRTPKQGHHLIFLVDPDDPPPGDIKFSDKRGRKIDIKSVGYTLLPPSMHPERHLGRYEYLHAADVRITMRWSDAQYVLHACGFFSADDREQIRQDVAGTRFAYDELLDGRYRRGERRRKQRSLYIKKRIMGSTAKDAERAVREINGTCRPPLPESEIVYNMRSAERWFGEHRQDFADGGMRDTTAVTGRQRKGKSKLDMHRCADIITCETRYIAHPSGDLYFYADGIWIAGGEFLLRKSCESRWRGDHITSGEIREIEELVRIRCAVIPDGTGSPNLFDHDPAKIVLRNGTFDLQQMRLVPHSADHMATVKHPITYDPDKRCPVFDRARRGWFDGDTRRETMILEMFALAFLRTRVIQKGYVHYGRGSNGKTTCLEMLRSMLGVRNTASVEMQSFESSRFVGDTLYGKNANISSDGGTQPLIKTGLIKAVLGGDSITCEPKHKRPFVYTPFCLLIFTFNELPPVMDASDGFARKVQLVPWEVRFGPQAADGAQPAACAAEIASMHENEDERSGVFNLLLPVMRRLLETRRLSCEDPVEKTQNMWMRRSDSFFLFREEYLVVSDRHQIETGRLLALYGAACKDHGMTPLGRNEFYARMTELLHGGKPIKTRVDGESVRVWRGVTVRSELRPDGQEAMP